MIVEIRPLRSDEHQEAGEVTALAYRELAEPVSTNPDYLARVADVAERARHALILGAMENGRVLGTVTVELTGRIPGGHPRPPLDPDQAHVRMLGVHPDAQGRGIGRRLMESAAEEARRAGKRRITLETTETMRTAQQLYESMGYRRLDDLEFDDGFRLRTYQLTL
ncbi:MAG TPA: GNAT family N-acetyltransferase [Actinomycetota bacterium]|nr:GNAT family N-acetyltransferase [Actinomycetota bacterium]